MPPENAPTVVLLIPDVMDVPDEYPIVVLFVAVVRLLDAKLPIEVFRDPALPEENPT